MAFRRRALLLLGLVLAAALPVLAHLARLLAHPGYYFDGETQIPATIGRELLHGHLADVFHYQIVLYQGSLVWDSLLAALGYATFGDSLLAWHVVPIAATAGLSIAGVALLLRTAGPWAAALFPLLIAAHPFLVKDGFVSGIGGHAPGAFYAVAALAVAVSVGEERPTHVRALVAGLVLAFAAWYVRTAILALPAVVLGVRAGGRRALFFLGGGLLLLPVLLAANTLIHLNLGSNATARGPLPELAAAVAWNVQGTSAERQPPAQKLGEATGVGVRTLLFAQPFHAETRASNYGIANYRAGLTWAVGWTVALFLLPVLVFLERRRSRDGPPLARSAPVWLLLGTYVAAYVLSHLNLDPGVLSGMQSYPPIPPGVSGDRYLVPVFAVATLAVAQGAGSLGRLLHPAFAVVAALPLIASGATLAVTDWTRDRDPPGLWRTMMPHQYSGAFGPFRGPPLRVHLECRDPDPESRAAHLEAIGRFLARPPFELQQSPDQLQTRLSDLADQGVDPADLRGIAMGLGADLAQYAQGEEGRRDLVRLAFDVGAPLGVRSGEPYLLGFKEGLGAVPFEESPAELVRLLCRSTPWGTRPLCPAAGERLVRDEASSFPASPEGLFVAGLPSWTGMPEGTRRGLLLGAVAGWTASGPQVSLRPESLDGWAPEEADLFRRAWSAREGPTD